MKKIYLTLFFVLAYFLPVMSQDIELEKTYEISGKAKKGNLGNAEFDVKSGNYVLTYVTKANDKMAKFEILYFDKDFNFLKTDIQELEFEVGKVKFPWWKFKSEEYSIDGVSADPNASNRLVLRKYNITYKYNWLWGYPIPKYKLLDKVKLTNDEGEKYYLLARLQDFDNGDLYVLCRSTGKQLHLLKINKNLDVVKDLEIKTTYDQFVVFSKEIIDKDANFKEMIFLLAPSKEGNATDPDKTRYTFLRYDNSLTLIDDITFNSKSSFWDVNDIILSDKPDEFFIYGPSAAGKDKYYDQLIGTEKFKAFQVMKINDHKVEYLTETNLDIFKSKLKTPPSQRKAPDYEGKKFDLAEDKILGNGDLLITGQNWGGKFNAISGNREFTYKDIVGFHFDSKGNLVSQFGIDCKENSGENMTPQILVESPDGKKVFWLIQEVKGVKGEGIGFQLAGIPQFSSLLKKRLLTYPRMGRIDIATDQISDFTTYGNEKFFIDNNFPLLPVPSEKKLVLFGANKAGDVIWFGRIRMD